MGGGRGSVGIVVVVVVGGWWLHAAVMHVV